MTQSWYVLRSKAHQEEAAWQQVLSRGIEAFYPRILVQPANPRARKVKPYFPGYLFVRIALEEVGVSAFRWMPHALGLVCFDGPPPHVPDELIAALRRHVATISQAGGELFYSLKPGDPVVIQNGPFAGYEGLFEVRLSGTDRARVLVKMLSDRFVPLELHAGQIAQRK